MGGTALVRVKKASGLRQAPSFPPPRPEDAARVPMSRLQRDTLFGLQSLCVDGLDACSAASSAHHRTFPSLPPTSDVPREVRTVRRAPFSPGVKLFVGEIFELWQDLVASQKQMWQRARRVMQRLLHAELVQVFDLWREHAEEKKQMRARAENMFPYARMWDAAAIDMLDILEDGLPPDERAANTPHLEINVTIKRVDHLPQKNPFVVLSFFEQVGTKNTFCHHCTVKGTNNVKTATKTRCLFNHILTCTPTYTYNWNTATYVCCLWMCGYK